MANTYLAHYGVKGQKWGVRRYQNEDGTLTEEGKKRYSDTSDKAKQEKKQDDCIKTLKKENERNKVINAYNEKISKQKKEEADATEKDYNNSIEMLRQGRNITSDLSVIARDPKKGSSRFNPKETQFKIPGSYSNLSDEELRKVVNRMQLERQYGDLSGDTKYYLTGREKTREYLQTIGAMLGIGVSALTIYKLIHGKSANKQ